MKNKVPKKTAAPDKEIVGEYYRYSGPLPHPSLLNQFDKKTREQIVGMAVAQSSHRQSIEKNVINSNTRNEIIGMASSFTLTLIMILVGAFLVHSDKQTIGFLTIFTPAIFQAKNYYDQKNREKSVSRRRAKDE